MNRRTTNAHGPRHNLALGRAILIAALLPGCAAVAIRSTPSGNTILGREAATFEVATAGMRVHSAHRGGWFADPYVEAEDGSTRVQLSASLDRAVPGDCREYYWNKMGNAPGVRQDSAVRTTRGQFSVVEYNQFVATDPRFQSVRVEQRTWVGCVTEGNSTAFLQLWKSRYEETDESVFVRVFEGSKLQSP